MKFPIYLDYSATTPVDPRVAKRMMTFITEEYGNPASRSHAYGWKADLTDDKVLAALLVLNVGRAQRP